MLTAKNGEWGYLCQAVPRAGLAQGDEECTSGLKNKQKTIREESVGLWLVSESSASSARAVFLKLGCS